MNPDLQKLHPYPFEKLMQLKAGIAPPADKPHIALSIGEPKHAPPEFVKKEMLKQLDRMGSYPLSKGIGELREAIIQWLV
ncbi:MAG: succinyldiaminopimelate transaminase, partial [Gammaproteobacteria bacterium SG8_15]